MIHLSLTPSRCHEILLPLIAIVINFFVKQQTQDHGQESSIIGLAKKNRFDGVELFTVYNKPWKNMQRKWKILEK